MNYKDYAMSNGHSEAQIEHMVGGLFDSISEMVLLRTEQTADVYSVCGWTLYSNHSTFDTLCRYDENGEEIESYNLEYQIEA